MAGKKLDPKDEGDVMRALSDITTAMNKFYEKIDFEVSGDDIVLNVQADEPMLRPDMIAATIQPMLDEHDVKGVVLSMPIIDEEQFYILEFYY